MYPFNPYAILGVGGSMGFAVPEKSFSFAYVMNRLDPEIVPAVDARYKEILNQVASKLNSSNKTSAKGKSRV